MNDEQSMTSGVRQRLRRGAQLVCGLATEDFDRRRQRLSAHHALDDVRVAGLRELAGVPLARHEERVLPDPGEVLLPMRQDEAARHEAPGDEIELAHRARILAAIRERDHAAPLLRWQAIRA